MSDLFHYLPSITGFLTVIGFCVWALVSSLAEEAEAPAHRWFVAHNGFQDRAQSSSVRKICERMSSRNRRERFEVVDILRRLNDRTATPALLRGLERYAGDPPLLEAIVVALGELGDLRALPALKKLSHNHNASLMLAAREAIARIEPQSVLLRPASASPAPAELLRAVNTPPETAPNELLRAGQ